MLAEVVATHQMAEYDNYLVEKRMKRKGTE
jgi:hypothetical protein